MISSIRLSNFKCFRSLEVQMGALNVFAGMNGAGKSTLIQSLLALRQSWESDSLPQGQIQLNGTLVDLGTAQEVYCAEPNSEFIEMAFGSSSAKDGFLLKSYQSEMSAGEYFLKLDSSDAVQDQAFILFQEPFNYLHAERVGPRKASAISPNIGHPLRVGKYGEDAPSVITSDRRETEITNSALQTESSDGKIYSTLQYQWPLWMARIFPGFQAESEIYSKADQVRLGLALQRKETGQSLFVRPTNTGFGISFVLGVVVAGLIAQPRTVLIVENPEAHLHPRAQSCMGEFLGRVAAGGAQVFVETHSEHVLNGIRRMVKQTILKSDEIRLHFFSRTDGIMEPVVTTIPVSETGDISNWPDGFFDQLDQDLSVILG